MNLPKHSTDTDWESDAVWKLLDESPRLTASPRFAADTVRAVRLMEQSSPWWVRLFAPLPIAGFVTATAAITLAVVSFISKPSQSSNHTAMLSSPEAVAIQEIAEAETLIAAADQLDDYSDTELVSLIGF